MRKYADLPYIAGGTVLALVGMAGPAFAQGIPEHTHHFGGGGMGFGAMMFLGPVFFLVLIAAVVAVVVLLLRGHGDRHSYVGHPPRTGRSPIDILNERFARGEIDKEEFEERRRTLGE